MSFTDNKFKFSAGLLVAGLILSGCGASGGKADKVSSPTESNKSRKSIAKKNYLAEPGLTPRQRFSKALEKLENGQDGQALAELQAYLQAVPRSNSARNLVSQITTDPSEYFPDDNFTVNLTSGASLSTLAKKYLGSALKFYALAKYNNIANPSRVDIGQAIKIPLTQLAKSVREEELNPTQPTPSQEELADVSEPKLAPIAVEQPAPEPEVSETDVEADAEAMAEDLPEAEVTPVVPEDTADSLFADLRRANEQQDYAVAMEKLTKLKTYGELNSAGQELALQTYVSRGEQIADTEPSLAASYFAAAGQIQLNNEQAFLAFDNFKRATDLDESNDQAMEEMLVLQKEISDKYHREASSAFRRQELDLAIEKWDLVLRVNPDHSSAKLYRAQALELKERLKSINQN